MATKTKRVLRKGGRIALHLSCCFLLPEKDTLLFPAGMRAVLFFLVLLAGILRWLPAGAEMVDGKHLTMEEIVVKGTPLSEPMRTEVDVRKIEQGWRSDIPDVLQDEPGIDLKRRAPVGDPGDSLSIRGLSGNRIMLSIDGRPINTSGVLGGHYIDWGTVPLDDIEKIEIIRGGSSVRYGNNALGGVVNVIPRKPTETPTLTFFGTYGGGGGIDAVRNVRITHTNKFADLGYSLAASDQKADPYLWNNDFEARNIAASVYLDMPADGLLTLACRYSDTERGFIRENRMSNDPDDPGFYEKVRGGYPLAFGETLNPYAGKAFLPGPNAHWNKTRYNLDFGYTQPIGPVSLDVRAYKNYEDRREKNYSSNGINPAYPDGQLVLDRRVESDRSFGARVEGEGSLGDHDLLLGAEYKQLSYGDTKTRYVDMTYNAAPWVSEQDLSFPPSSEGTCVGAYVQDTWMPTDRWVLTGGLRFDHYRNRPTNGSGLPERKDDTVTPKFTGTFRWTGEDTVTASVYQALRTPGLPETYWWAEGETHGDPRLKPEKNTAVELAYRHVFGSLGFLRLCGYYYNIDDYIVFRMDPTWRGVYNIDRVELYGASLDGRVSFTDWAEGTVAVTWQESDKGRDPYDPAHLLDELDDLPEWKVSAGGDLHLPFRSVFSLRLHYVSKRDSIYAYRTGGWPAEGRFKRVSVDPYVTLDLGLEIPVTTHGEIRGYVENLFDAEYEERFGYPMPGTIAGVALKVWL